MKKEEGRKKEDGRTKEGGRKKEEGGTEGGKAGGRKVLGARHKSLRSRGESSMLALRCAHLFVITSASAAACI